MSKVGSLIISNKDENDIKIGDMFKFFENVKDQKSFIYLGEKECYEIPFNPLNNGNAYVWQFDKCHIKKCYK